MAESPGVFLLLHGGGRKEPLVFVVPDPESIQMGYTVDLQDDAKERRTHPPRQRWLGGKIKDLPLKLHLVAGLSPGIPDADVLASYVQAVFDMSLPPIDRSTGRAKKCIEVVGVEIVSNGRSWFRLKGFMQDVTVKWGRPIDVDSGRPCSAELNLVIRPTFVNKTTYDSAADDKLPKRPFQFSKVY